MGMMGNSERTKDERFDKNAALFKAMTEDMRNCETALASMCTNLARTTTEAKELATALTNIYKKDNDGVWDSVDSKLLQIQASEILKEVSDEINDSLRPSINSVIQEQAIEPINKKVAIMVPEFDSLQKARKQALLDYDANRRRLDGHRKKKTELEAANQYIEDKKIQHDGKIDQYEGKTSTAGAKYEEVNERGKQFTHDCKVHHDELIDSLVITSAVAQLEFYKRAAANLEKVVATFSQQEVDEVRSRIDEVLALGGHIIQQPVKKRSSSAAMMERMSGIFGGSTTTSQNSPRGAPEDPTSSAPTLTGSSNEPDGNPFAEEDGLNRGNSMPVAESVPSAQPVSTTKKNPFVKALHQHIAEDEDELGFEEGDMIEVLEAENEDWWTGRCQGREGIFPVNFVDTSTMN